MPVWETKGLSAKDRSAEDKKQIELQGTDFNEPVKADSLKISSSKEIYTPTPISAIPEIQKYNEVLFERVNTNTGSLVCV